MRRYGTHIFIACLCVFGCLIASCSDDPTGPAGASVLGDWTWVESCGGFAGECRTPEKIGHSQSLVFASGFVYFEYEDGRLVSGGTYKRTRSDDNIFGRPMDALEMSSRPCLQLIISLTSDELELADNCYDGFASRYEKNR
jgi:hypothetical protein